MRALGLLGLMITLLIVAFLTKKQLEPRPLAGVPPVPGASAPTNAIEQSRQLQEHVQRSLDAATQPRKMPDGL